MTKKYPVVIVEWEDAWGTDQAANTDDLELRTPLIRRSAGYLIRKRPQMILAITLDGKRRLQNILAIPPKMVRKVTRLKEDG